MPPWLQIVLSSSVLVFVAERVYAAILRHREHVRALEQHHQQAQIVSEAECRERREDIQARWEASCTACRAGVGRRLDDGDEVFLWVEAALRVLVRKMDVAPREIEEEISLLRKGRRVHGH